MSDEIKITTRFLDGMGYDLTLGVFIYIVRDYRAGDATEMQRIADTYNTAHATNASLDEIANAMQAYIDEENRHLMGFMRAMAHEEIDPIGFHEQAFFDNLGDDKDGKK